MAERRSDGPSSAIQLVTFHLGSERYGVNIMDVQEIVRLQEIRTIPNAPSYIAGILNLRGEIIPIVDLHRRFGLATPEQSAEEQLLRGIMILDLSGMRVGVIIDRVSRVLTITPDRIQPSPQMVSGIGAEYIQGVVSDQDDYLIILNIRRLFSAHELRQIDSITV